MPTQLFTIARNAFVESIRQPILFVLILISGLLQVLNTWGTNFSMGQESATAVKGDNKLLLDIGLATIFGCGTLLAAFIATAVLSREIENKTVLTVVSKPVSRSTVVFGKYLGVTGAIIAAVIIMLIFLLFGIRHGVMSTSADELDGPVLVYALGATFLSLALGAWSNYFYGWNFPQTVVGTLLPLSMLAYVAMLFTSKKWGFQSPATDFNFQVFLACVSLGLAILVLTSVAVAASTRLSQVMTIVVCVGVFVVALFSNYLVGRHVFAAQPIGAVALVRNTDPEKTILDRGSVTEITLEQPSKLPLKPGDAVYFSSAPNGFPALTSTNYGDFTGKLDEANETLGPSAVPALVMTEGGGNRFRVRHQGSNALRMLRSPEPGDYVFVEPGRMNVPALVAWGVLPNLQFFWLLDAISQGRRVPVDYVLLAGCYAACQVGVFLSIAVMLFQRRDLG